MTTWREVLHPRDHDGKFARGEGWINTLSDRIAETRARDSAGYKPGDWRVVTRDEEVAVLAADMYRGAMEVDPSLDPDWLRGIAIEEAEKLTTGGQTITLRNGSATITSRVDEIGEQQLRRIADQVDDLQTRYPTKGRIAISVIPNNSPMSHEHAEAETIRGEGFIRIKAQSFDEDIDRHGFMPAAQDHSRADYVLAHEWGHAIDYHPEMELFMLHLGDNSVHLSDYGQSSSHEALAEAFAEWYLTKGHTTNQAAIEYATRFGWGQPW